jgi:hypothetical protein
MKGKPFQKILGVLKGVAPTAVAALGGPFAPLAAGVIRNVLGAENASESGLEAAVLAAAGDPASVVKLKEIEAEMANLEGQMGIRFEELEVEDRKDARLLARETSIYPQLSLTVVFVLGYFVVLGLFFSSTLIVPMSEAFMVMLGVLTAGMTQLMAFWFGSSKGSQDKTNAITAAR